MTTSGGFASYFGTELRRLREQKGWTREEFAEHLPWSVWTLTSVEQGRRKPPPGLGEHADVLFALPGVMAGLGKKAQDDSTPFGDFVDLEQRALSARVYDTRVVPGLLQTPAYARAINQIPGQYISPDDLDRLVQIRMNRQKVLNRERALSLHVILDEAVLCRRVGNTEIMREQFDALIQPRQNVITQILPFTAGPHDGAGGPLTILRLPDEPEIAYVDNWTRGLILDTPAELLRAGQALEQITALALPPDMSAEMTQAYMEEM